MSEPSVPHRVSRRKFLHLNSGLLAAVALGAAPVRASAATSSTPASATSAGTPGSAGPGVDLALYRPVQVSSTDYAPTPGAFAVDGVSAAGSAAGTGWRAAAGDPQWITVDLQAVCRIDAIGLVFEATGDTPPFEPSGGDPRADTLGDEILSSCAVAYAVAVSTDEQDWQDVYTTTTGAGGAVHLPLSAPVSARWVRLTVTQRSNENPLGLGEFQVYGTAPSDRPSAVGWTTPRHKHPAPDLVPVPDGTVPLESGWELVMDVLAASGDGVVLSRPGVETSGWFDAVVPGTVLDTLVTDGALPDPVAGMNNLRVPEALCRHSWWYRRQFQTPGGLHGSRVWLEFDGVNHEAEVWLNGTRIGTVTYPFARAAFDVTDLLHGNDGQNTLAVRIDPMPHPGSPGDKADGVSFVNSYELELDAPTYACASGWDWMPAVRDRACGIWNHVRLRPTGDVVLGDVQITTTLPNLPATDVAEVAIAVPVRNAARSARTVTVEAEFGTVRVRGSATVAAGATSTVTLAPQRVKNPKLWWPNGYGAADLYDLTLTASIAGRPSDVRRSRLGIRQIDYAYQRPTISSGQQQVVTFEPVQARYVRLYGYTRATIYGFSLFSLSLYGPNNPDTDLALHQPATASSVDGASDAPGNAVDGDPNTRWSSAFQDDQWLQVDLGAVVTIEEARVVWETAFATKYAIQVSLDGSTWADAATQTNNSPEQLKISVNGVRVMCRGGNWGFDELLRRVLDGRLDNALRLHADQNFTMIRNWLGTANREEFFALCDQYGILVWTDFWWAGDHPPNDPDGYIAVAADTIRRYRAHPCIAVWCGSNEHYPAAAIDQAVAQAIADEDPTRLYQNNSAADIVGGHGPYSWVDPVSYYSTSDFGFHTEIGIPTVSTAETMLNLAGDDPAWPIGVPWDYHDWCAQGGQAVESYRQAIEDRLGPATGLADFCAKAQFVNYESMRAIFEAWNHNLWQDAAGVLLWMSHPTWYSTVWQTYDYDFDVNGSYYGARKGCEPLHIQAALDSWQVEVVNHTPRALTGVLATAQVFDATGTAQGSPQQITVDVPISSKAAAFTVAWPWNSVTFPAVSARYVRMAGGTRATQYGFSLYTMSVYGPAEPGTDLALHQVATASSTDDPSREPGNAVDGDPTTRWSSAYEDDQWLQVDLGSVVEVDRVDLTWETAMAKTFAIETSVDGETWTSARSVTVGGLHLVRLQARDAAGDPISDNTYWHYATPSDMQALNTLPAASLTVTVLKSGTDGERSTATVQVRNTGSTVAPMVVLSLRTGADRVLPTLYSDNYLWLLPGESRAIDIDCATSDLRGASPTVQVTAFGGTPITVSV